MFKPFKCQLLISRRSVFTSVSFNFAMWILTIDLNTKFDRLFCSRFCPLSKTRTPFSMILWVEGARAISMDVYIRHKRLKGLNSFVDSSCIDFTRNINITKYIKSYILSRSRTCSYGVALSFASTKPLLGCVEEWFMQPTTIKNLKKQKKHYLYI